MEDFDDKIAKATNKVNARILELQDNLNNVELLSLNLPKLAVANISLGRYAAYATYLARNAERAYKRKREDQKLHYMFQKWTAAKSEAQAFVDVEADFQVYSEAQRVADEARDLTYRTDTFIDQARSRLSLISKEMNRTF